jgi:hypothetical protein
MKENEGRVNGRRKTAQKEFFCPVSGTCLFVIRGVFFLFFSPILLCSHNGDPPDEELAKFGYTLESKVDKLLKSWLYFGNLLS